VTVRLENLTDRPVLLTLSTGDVLRLSPGEMSEGLEDVEVQASTKIEKLVAQGVITMHEPPKRSTAKKVEKTSPQESEKKDGGAKETTE
jgi:hypothetical protein